MKTDILGYIAKDLSEQYKTDNELYLSVGNNTLVNTFIGKYTFEYGFLVQLCIMHLISDGILSKSTRMDSFFPDINKETTVYELLYLKSGICDAEITFADAIKDKEQTLELISDLPVDKRLCSNEIDRFLLYVTAEKASGKAFPELCKFLFGADATFCEASFCISGKALCSFAENILHRSLAVDFSLLYCFDENSDGIGCKNDNGFIRFILNGDNCCDICIDYDAQVLFIAAGKQRDEGFIRNVLDNAEILYAAPKNVRLCPLSPENAGRVNGLSVDFPQLEYTCDIKSALLYAYSRNRSSYAICDGLRTVGAVVLDENAGEIEYVAIDKRFQSKGYGRAAVYLCISRLRDVGASHISIAVDNRNKRAFSLYTSCGFSVLHRCAEYSLLELKNS